MLPFVRMLEYGNIKPILGGVKKIDGWGNGYPLFVLYHTGELYGIGRSYNTFGDGVDATYTEWKLIRSDVDDIYCGYTGAYSTIIKTKGGQYFISGGSGRYVFNDMSISNDIKFVDVTTHMVLPSALELKSLRYTGNTLFAIDTNDNLYVSGSQENYVTGMGVQTYTKWVLSLSNVKQIAVSTDRDWSWVLTNDNKLYRAGINTRYTLAIGTNTNSVITRYTEYVNSAYVVNGIYAQGYKIYFITDTGSLYVCGLMDGNGSAGNGTKSGYLAFPNNSGFTVSAVQKIYSTLSDYYNTFLVDSSGLKYAGTPSSGQGGTGSSAAAITFKSTVGLPVININKFYLVTGNSCTYILNDGLLYAAGYKPYMYGVTEGSTYITSFVPMPLPV